MATDTAIILRLLADKIIDSHDAFLLFSALQGRPLPIAGAPVRRQDPLANRDFARSLLRQVA